MGEMGGKEYDGSRVGSGMVANRLGSDVVRVVMC